MLLTLILAFLLQGDTLGLAGLGMTNDTSVTPSDTSVTPSEASVSHNEASPEFDMDEYLYGHVVDAYDWHITTVNGKHISVPLLIIARSKTTGWHVFSSGKLVRILLPQ